MAYLDDRKDFDKLAETVKTLPATSTHDDGVGTWSLRMRPVSHLDLLRCPAYLLYDRPDRGLSVGGFDALKDAVAMYEGIAVV